MGNAIRGTFAVVLESLNSPGQQLLQALTPILATMSIATQPSGSTGMKLHVIVIANIATGSVTITGTDINGNPLTETVSNIPIQPVNSQSPILNSFEYCTQDNFATVNASGITTTGLTNGQILIYGCQAAKILIPGEFECDVKPEYYSPKEHRGLIYQDTNVQQTVKQAEWQNKHDLYPETSLYALYACFSASPTVTNLMQTLLKNTTTVSTAPWGLTTQPSGPGMPFVVTITSSTAIGTIIIAGVNVLSQNVTETIVAAQGGSNGNGVYYTSNIFASVNTNGISFTGLTGGSAKVQGVYGYDYIFQPQEQVYSLAGEDYSGTDSNAIPLMTPTDFEVNQDVKKSIDLTLKGFAQDNIPIGDRTTTNMTGSRTTQLGQPLDKPIVGWQSQTYIDPIPSVGGTPGTTAYGDVETFKLMVKLPAEPEFNATNQQIMNSVYRTQITGEFQLAINFKNVLQYEQFRKNGIQVFQVKYLGPILGVNGSGALIQKAWIFTFAAKYKAVKRKRDKKVTADITGTIQYEPSLGYGVQVEVICLQPPTLPN